MGWSYWVSCKSKKAATEVAVFLERHYRDTMEIPDLAKLYTRGALSGRKSPDSWFNSSAESPVKLGYYKPDDYQQAVLRWLAFRVGKKRTFKVKLGDGFGALPWVNHDGQTSVPVIHEAQWDDQDRTMQYLVDDIGWQGVHRFWEDFIPDAEYAKKLAGWVSGATAKDKAIRAEIERLDELWNERKAA
jgi:hypothetical protein